MSNIHFYHYTVFRLFAASQSSRAVCGTHRIYPGVGEVGLAPFSSISQ